MFSSFRRSFVLAALALAVTLTAATAQTLRIAAVVNEDVISVYDVNERIRFVLFSAGIPDTPEARRQIAPQVIRSLIDEKLEMQEAKRLNITIDQHDYQETISHLENQNHLPAGKLFDFISAKGINPKTLDNQIRATLMWGQVVRRRAQGHVVVTDEEIKEAHDRIVANMKKPSRLVADIFLAVDAPEDDASVRANIEHLRQELLGGAEFVGLARQFSQDASAQQGGDLGWVPQGQLDPELDRALDHMKPGDLSEPIRTAAGYYLVLLRDERAPGASNDPEIGLMNVTIPAGPGHANAADELRRLAQTVSGCDDFARSVHEADSAAKVGTLKAKLSEMSPNVRSIVANLPVGHISDPLPVGSGVQAVMVCSRQGGEAVLPSLDQVGRILTAQKLEQFSQRLLRDLRQTAFIDLRV
jgi:peptidyl-prolyl cis-trans isomerase SurA